MRKEEQMSSPLNQGLGGAPHQTKLNQSFGYLGGDPEMQFLPFSPNSTTGDPCLFGRQNDLIQVALKWVRLTTHNVGAGNINDITTHFRASIDQRQITGRGGPV